jgi:hypothetical protein
LVGRCSITLTTLPAPFFALVKCKKILFWDKILLYDWVGLDHNAPIFASLCNWDDRCVPPCLVIGWDGVLWTFCLGWLQTKILLISTSQVARIIGLNHHARPLISD